MYGNTLVVPMENHVEPSSKLLSMTATCGEAAFPEEHDVGPDHAVTLGTAGLGAML
jgi:hypothetical protein